MTSRLNEPYLLLATLALLLLVRTTDTEAIGVTSADVGRIATLAIDAALIREPVDGAVRMAAPLRIDVEGSNASFEKLFGRQLLIDRAHWLPGVPHEVVRIDAVRTCPALKAYYEHCTLAGNGELARIARVTTDSVPGALTLLVEVLEQRHYAGQPRMHMYRAVIVARREDDHWRARALHWIAF